MMFEELKYVIEEYEQIATYTGTKPLSREQEEFMDNSYLYFAKAILNEVPQSEVVAKIILAVVEGSR